MKKIIYLPFEHLPQRYTEMWNSSFRKELQPNDIVVRGDDSGSHIIQTGEFLDTFNTIRFKQSQISEAANMFQHKEINNGDVFFIPDIFYPGMEAIRYMAELSGIKVGIVAFNHAGRADEDDFVQNLNTWADVQEQAWHDMSDIVLVGSQYHANRVKNKFKHNDVRVVGAIWDKEWMVKKTRHLPSKKEDYVIFPHRISKEKGIDLFLEIARSNENLQFVITSCGKGDLKGIELPNNVSYMPNLTKEQYFEIFKKARYYLSTAFQETFGYTVQEAIFFDCKIIAPNYASYPEYLNKCCLVEREDMSKQNFIQDKFLYDIDIDMSFQFEDNAKKIYKICEELCIT